MTNQTIQQVSELFSTHHPLFSLEIFPPKGDLSLEEASTLARELAPLDPGFISVTCSAGGSSNGSNTVQVAKLIQEQQNITTVAHLTCQGLTKDDLDQRAQTMADAGIKNVLALRGDPQPNMQPGDFCYASDLIGPLVDKGFCVGVAAYPEGHVSCLDVDLDVRYLKLKQDQGASFLVTQLFFDNQEFYRFLDRCERAHITVPITAGIMPVLSKSQVQRMVFMCGASLPSRLVKLLARYEGDAESLRKAGIEYAAQQLSDLAMHGVAGLHLYTMNRPEVARACLDAAELCL